MKTRNTQRAQFLRRKNAKAKSSSSTVPRAHSQIVQKSVIRAGANQPVNDAQSSAHCQKNGSAIDRCRTAIPSEGKIHISRAQSQRSQASPPDRECQPGTPDPM